MIFPAVHLLHQRAKENALQLNWNVFSENRNWSNTFVLFDPKKEADI